MQKEKPVFDETRLNQNITLVDYFAGQALNAMLSVISESEAYDTCQVPNIAMVENAYGFACFVVAVRDSVIKNHTSEPMAKLHIANELAEMKRWRKSNEK